ncbi:MAG: sugar O-acetyltransferase [Bacilli bacterium]
MKERIKNGELFSDNCEGMPKERAKAKSLMRAYNRTGSSKLGIIHRFSLMKKIFGRKTLAWIEPPFYFCYGKHIKIGDYCYLNVNCSFIDDGEIEIGDHTEFGPNVVIATVSHPINPDYRPLMYAEKVTIGKNCWIGASVTILPGVTIGNNSVIGAGSVVTKDIPDNVIAYGNPCKVIRPFNDNDLKTYNKNKPIDKEDIETMLKWEKEHH